MISAQEHTKFATELKNFMKKIHSEKDFKMKTSHEKTIYLNLATAYYELEDLTALQDTFPKNNPYAEKIDESIDYTESEREALMLEQVARGIRTRETPQYKKNLHENCKK